MKPDAKLVLLLAYSFLFWQAIAHKTSAANTPRPNIVLVMADDLGWGQTGYYGHPILKTPNLDAMAARGLRLDRFYAAGPVCSPTRASVLTGRTHNRTGVLSHGYALHLQERSLASAMQAAGYATSHFGKWHLNGVRGPGVPVLASDPYHPGRFGFDHWLTVTNFFDMNPIMSRMGEFEEFHGDSSEIIVEEALKHISQSVREGRPFFTVIWYGSPHSPWEAFRYDQIAGETDRSAHHHGEIVAMDRSIGALREGLREFGVEHDTLVWFCSDNGGLPGVGHDSVGGLRGNKGSIWEGGIRVPAIIEWPARVRHRVTSFPASTMDIFPTLIDLLQLPDELMLPQHDGISLRRLLGNDVNDVRDNERDSEEQRRDKPIPFYYQRKAALIDNDLKIVQEKVGSGKYLLFDLKEDKTESHDLFASRPDAAKRLAIQLEQMIASIEASQRGADYAEEKVTREGPHGRSWTDIPEYQAFLDEWSKRPEYAGQIRKKRRAASKSHTNPASD